MATSLLTRVKARVDLHTSNRARGLIQGRGRSMFKGSGEDFDDLKYYQPGDKISDIDWKATARSGEPLIRQFNEERVRHLSIVADTSSSMSATAADGTSKREAMILAAGMICFLAQKNGDLVGLVGGDEQRPIQLPSRSSDGHLELLLRSIQQATTTASGASDSAWLLERAFRVTSRSTLMTIITDEAHPDVEDFSLLRRLTTRHDVMMVRIADADPLQRESLDHDVVDVDNPREVASLARSSKRVARDVEAYRRARREGISEMMNRLHISHRSEEHTSELQSRGHLVCLCPLFPYTTLFRSRDDGAHRRCRSPAARVAGPRCGRRRQPPRGGVAGALVQKGGAGRGGLPACPPRGDLRDDEPSAHQPQIGRAHV